MRHIYMRVSNQQPQNRLHNLRTRHPLAAWRHQAAEPVDPFSSLRQVKVLLVVLRLCPASGTLSGL